MQVSIIVAVAENGVIGGGNALLWHIPEDLKRFKQITWGHTIIMGRKTFESIGRPLPNRRNIVVTRNPRFFAGRCEQAGSLDEALAMAANEAEVFVVGGGEIYRMALPLAKKLYLTRVHAVFEGDTYFPKIEPEEWKLVKSEKINPASGPGYSFEEYLRVNR